MHGDARIKGPGILDPGPLRRPLAVIGHRRASKRSSCARRFHAPLAYDGQENDGQDEAAKHQGHVEAVQKEDQPLRVLAYVLMQIVVGLPGDEQPADGEVHGPCPKPRPIGDLAHQGQPESEERDP